jgi:hypothetical protein
MAGESFASKSKLSANGAEYESQGQARSASPLEAIKKFSSPEKGVITSVFRPFQAWVPCARVPGDALRACPWLTYFAPLALYHTRWRSVSKAGRGKSVGMVV